MVPSPRPASVPDGGSHSAIPSGVASRCSPGSDPRETVSLYAAPLQARVAPCSSAAPVRGRRARLGRRALGFSPLLALRLPPSLQLPTDCCEGRKMGEPAHAPPAAPHAYTHTLTPARSLPPGSHPSIEKHITRARLLPAPPHAPLPAPASRRPLARRCHCGGLAAQKVEHPRAGRGCGGGASSTCHVPTFASFTHTQTHTHTHTEDAHT